MRLHLLAVAAMVCAGTAFAEDEQPPKADDALLQVEDAPLVQDEVKVIDSRPPVTKVICKREPVKGSRARTEKICMTVANWESQREQVKKNISRANKGGTCS